MKEYYRYTIIIVLDIIQGIIEIAMEYNGIEIKLKLQCLSAFAPKNI